MSTSAGTASFLLEQLAALGTASLRRMFGEYCLYVAGVPVGLVCDDQLFLKPTEHGRALCSPAREGSPYPGAKPHLLITADLWEDSVWLCQLVAGTARDLPAAKPKAKARARVKAKATH